MVAIDATAAPQTAVPSQVRNPIRSRAQGPRPAADAAAWAIIDILPPHPVVTAAVAGTATGRAKSAVHAAMEQLEAAGVLVPITGGDRSRSWEPVGLLDLIADLEAGELPPVA